CLGRNERNLVNKKDIIEAIAYAVVSDQKNGLEIVAARDFAEVLKKQTSNCSELPDSRLFKRLHGTFLEWHQAEMEGLPLEEAKVDVVKEHKKLVECLRQIGRDLGIIYQEPYDPLLSRAS
ncbi:MAG: hypothetical protein Q7R65_03445, partial [bacterium]|nr:hypothetical protein [bacterium]